MGSTPTKGEGSVSSTNRLFIPGKSMHSLLRKKVVASPEKPIEERLNDFDLDANEILSPEVYPLFEKNLTASEICRMVRELKSGTEALFPKPKPETDVCPTCHL